ncbi:MAG: hypothetical protein JW839_01650 [Candidatus Lokiarchaeota archaeon]|nr:hypothetical protein [Candidatus Lokiarchaeota archaeon]
MELIKKFPDPFVRNNGKRVASLTEWETRREEIKEIILDFEYGTMPGPPARVDAVQKGIRRFDFGDVLESIQLVFTPHVERPDVTFSVDVSIWLPSEKSVDEKRKQIPEFGKDGLPTLVCVGGGTFFDMLDQGYEVITFQNTQIEPDKQGNPLRGPARRAYDEVEPGNYTWGSIAIWAWGARRVLDYALTRKEVNKQHVIVSGHSRNGKAALLAGALDERFSLVNPAGSGCGGAGSFLALGDRAESLGDLVDRKRWWAWMHPEFAKFARRESLLPFDQHFVMGLVAPRPLLRVEGIGDVWANPEGTSCAFLATEPVYEYLGVPDRNGVNYRLGGHEHNDEDREALMRFAEWHFFGIPPGRSFKDLVVQKDDVPALFDWRAPGTR